MEAANALGLQVSLIQARHAHRLHRVHMLEPGICRVNHGTKRVQLGEQGVAVSGGQWVLLPAQLPMQVENVPGAQGYQAQVLTFPQALLTEFHQRHATHWHPPARPPGIPQWALPANARLDAAWQRLQQSLADQEPALLQLHLLQEMWLLLALSGQLWPLLSPPNAGISWRVQQVLMADPSTDWAQETVAARLCMSSPTLRRRLAAEGQSFREILESVRMAHALNHLQTTRRRIEDIALACGYASPSRFAERFRRRYGMSPRELRKAL